MKPTTQSTLELQEALANYAIPQEALVYHLLQWTEFIKLGTTQAAPSSQRLRPFDANLQGVGNRLTDLFLATATATAEEDCIFAEILGRRTLHVRRAFLNECDILHCHNPGQMLIYGFPAGLILCLVPPLSRSRDIVAWSRASVESGFHYRLDQEQIRILAAIGALPGGAKEIALGEQRAYNRYHLRKRIEIRQKISPLRPFIGFKCQTKSHAVDWKTRRDLITIVTAAYDFMVHTMPPHEWYSLPGLDSIFTFAVGMKACHPKNRTATMQKLSIVEEAVRQELVVEAFMSVQLAGSQFHVRKKKQIVRRMGRLKIPYKGKPRVLG